MATNTSKRLITLEEISRQKKDISRQIKKQKQLIQLTATNLFAPVKATNKIELIINSVNSGLAMVDGVMTGMKMMRHIRSIFKRKK